MEENKFLEKTPFKKKSSEKEIIRVIGDEIEGLRNYTHEVISSAKQNEYGIALNLISSEIISVSNKISEFLNSRYMEIESLEEEIGALKERIRQQDKYYKEKLEQKATKDREELVNLAERMGAFMRLVDENVKVVSASTKIKRSHGRQKDTRITDEEVVALYKKGLSTQRIADYYNSKYGGIIVTGSGIKNRLVSLGVYEGRRL